LSPFFWDDKNLLINAPLARPQFWYFWMGTNEDLDRVQKDLLAKLPEREIITGFQFRINGRDNTPLYIECNARCINCQDQSSEMQLVLRDITQRKQLEDELQSAYEHLNNTRE